MNLTLAETPKIPGQQENGPSADCVGRSSNERDANHYLEGNNSA